VLERLGTLRIKVPARGEIFGGTNWLAQSCAVMKGATKVEKHLADRSNPTVSGAEPELFGVFFDRWRDPIRRSLALVIGDVGLADEAVDEAMARALASWEKVGLYDKPEGWVYRVGLNWARDVFRRRRYEIVAQMDPDSKSTETAFPDLDVIEAVGRLSVPLRAVVVGRFYLDWSTREVADALDIAEGTVKSRLSRALRRLERILEVQS
jgi:RNA polymerase sigma factor (sigma-70 family)